MFCKFITIQENIHKCQVCGLEIRLKQDPSKIWRNCQPPKNATLLDSAVNLVTTMTDYVASGFQNSTDAEKNRRLEICQSCKPHYENGLCKLCGCDMALKSRIETAHCPIGKW